MWFSKTLVVNNTRKYPSITRPLIIGKYLRQNKLLQEVYDIVEFFYNSLFPAKSWQDPASITYSIFLTEFISI